MATPSHVDLSVLWVPIMPETSGMDAAMADAAKGAKDTFEQNTKDIGQPIEDNLEKTGSKVKERFKDWGHSIRDTFQKSGKDSADTFNDELEKGTKSKTKSLGDSLGETLGSELGRAIGENLRQIPIVDQLANSFKGVASAVQDIKAGNLGGVLGDVNGVLDKLAPVASRFGVDISGWPSAIQNVVGPASNLVDQYSQLKGNISTVSTLFGDFEKDAPGIAGALGMIGDAAGPLAVAFLTIQGTLKGLNEFRNWTYGVNTPPPAGVDPGKWYQFNRGGGSDAYDLFPHGQQSGAGGLGSLLGAPPAPPAPAPAAPGASGPRMGPPSHPGAPMGPTISGGQSLLPPMPGASQPSDLGGLLGGGGAGTAGFTTSSGETVHIRLADSSHPLSPAPPGGSSSNFYQQWYPAGGAANQSGSAVPLMQNPDGTWTSPNPAWAHLIQRESGGRTAAINNYDSNAMAGDPSRGLFQFTNATWLRSGGGKYAPRADLATPQQQAEVAANLIRANPSGSDWGAGMSGRENASALLAGLGAPQAGSSSGYNFYEDWYPGGGTGGGIGPGDGSAPPWTGGGGSGGAGSGPRGSQHDPLYVTQAAGTGGGGSPEQNQGQQLGQGMINGMMQAVGLDGSVFKGFGGSSNPLQFGITKLATGLLNWSMGTLGGHGGAGPLNAGLGGGGGPSIGGLGALIPGGGGIPAHLGGIPTGPGGAQNVPSGNTTIINGDVNSGLNVTQHGVQSPTEDLQGAANAGRSYAMGTANNAGILPKAP